MEKNHCLNCGNDFEGNYCPRCGQNAKVRRLSFESVIVEGALETIHMDSGVGHTVVQLLIRPWKVIAEFIRGRRKSYTKPVQLLLVLLVVTALVKHLTGMSALEYGMGAELAKHAAHTGTVGHAWDELLLFIGHNRIAEVMLGGIMVAIAGRLAYRRFGSRRFNTFEYCTAYLYYMSMLMAIDVVTAPLYFINQWLYIAVASVWTFGLGVAIVWRAFRIPKRWLRVLMLFVANLVFVVVNLIAMAVVKGIDYALTLSAI